MNVVDSLTYTADGVLCAECGEPIRTGEDAVVAMNGAIDETLDTGDPQVMTFEYAGVYHRYCFTDEGQLDMDELSTYLEQEVDRKLDTDDYQEDNDGDDPLENL